MTYILRPQVKRWRLTAMSGTLSDWPRMFAEFAAVRWILYNRNQLKVMTAIITAKGNENVDKGIWRENILQSVTEDTGGH